MRSSNSAVTLARPRVAPRILVRARPAITGSRMLHRRDTEISCLPDGQQGHHHPGLRDIELPGASWYGGARPEKRRPLPAISRRPRAVEPTVATSGLEAEPARLDLADTRPRSPNQTLGRKRDGNDQYHGRSTSMPAGMRSFAGVTMVRIALRDQRVSLETRQADDAPVRCVRRPACGGRTAAGPTAGWAVTAGTARTSAKRVRRRGCSEGRFRSGCLPRRCGIPGVPGIASGSSPRERPSP